MPKLPTSNSKILKGLQKNISTQREEIKQSIKKSQAAVSSFLKKRFKVVKDLTPRLVHNNKSTLLSENKAFPEMISCMKSAKKSINIEMYIFKDDEIGRKIAGVLKEAVKRGVRVNILYDAFGSKYTSNAFFSDLIASGIKVAEHNSINPIKSLRSFLFEINKRDHRKIIVVDGKIAFIGGMNFAKHYYRDWRDVMVKFEGPIVSDLQLSFFKQWQRFELKPLGSRKIKSYEDTLKLHKTYKELYFPALKEVGNQTVGVITGNPRRSKKRVHKLYLNAIRNAKREIVIETPYFVPTYKLLRLLIKKARQGVNLKIILADSKSSDHPTVNLLATYFIGPLIKAGAKTYFCSYGKKIFHTKLAVIDKRITIVGSSNLDSRSFIHNYEINAVIFDEQFAKEALTHISDDLNESRIIKLSDISLLSVKEKIISNVYWIFRGWL